ncbi:MAG TPA: hypothetical protein VKF41_06835 [Bryobacteraceae bacterium]|nr:hypothetical protein [Bryobacteraceae bacterium]
MDKHLSEILNAIPPKPPRSKLEPYYDLIRELRRRSKTYREIAKVLEEHVGLRVDHSTICDFVRLRVRWAKAPRRVDELPPWIAANRMTPPQSEVESSLSPGKSTASGGTSDAYARIAALKRRKRTSKPADPGFQYEEGAPLRLVFDPAKK